MLYTVPFTISGYIELEAESADDAAETIRDWSSTTILDLAMTVTIDIATADTISYELRRARMFAHDAGHGTYFPGPCAECQAEGWLDEKGRM